jgi:cytosine/adenosine deaminase-related metal-dependent hydrolase
MIISAPLVLPMRRNGAPLRQGAVAVRGNSIIAVGPADSVLRRHPSHRIISLHNAVLLPGLVNVHAHLELPPLLDAVRSTSFPGWILNLIAAKRGLSLSDYAEAASANIRRLIETGTTTVGEISTHGASPGLLKRSGLRAVVFKEFIGMDPAAEFNSSLGPGRNTSLVRFGLSPHTPYTVSEKALRSIAAYALSRDLRLAVHVAESSDEERLLQGKRSGLHEVYRAAGWDPAWAPTARSAVQYLRAVGLLNSRLLAVHAVRVTDQDIKLMKNAHCSIAHCPRSNRELGVGRMPLGKMLDAGITVGLGTDSLASCPNLNMWDEMRAAYRLHARDGVTAEEIMAVATRKGAQALGFDNLGVLTTGNEADLIAAPLPTKDTGNIFVDLLRETTDCMFSMVGGKALHS